MVGGRSAVKSDTYGAVVVIQAATVDGPYLRIPFILPLTSCKQVIIYLYLPTFVLSSRRETAVFEVHTFILCCNMFYNWPSIHKSYEFHVFCIIYVFSQSIFCISDVFCGAGPRGGAAPPPRILRKNKYNTAEIRYKIMNIRFIFV